MQISPTLQISSITKSWAEKAGLRVLYRESIDSTNTLAKEMCSADGCDFDLILCDQQPAGRGRGHNTWLAPKPGTSLLSSWIFSLNYAPQPILAPLLGLALYQSARAAFFEVEKYFSLKPPNDLYLGTQKIAGLLIENVQIGTHTFCVVGLGLNALAAPEGIVSAGRLSENTSLPLTVKVQQKSFENFLSLFLKNLKHALGEAKAETMSESVRAEILLALNARNSHAAKGAANSATSAANSSDVNDRFQGEKFLSVGPRGELQTSSKTYSWLEL